MSIEHMRTANTLARNIEMSFEVECGLNFQQVATEHKVRPSSVRSSVTRVRAYLLAFVQKFPQELRGQDARRSAYKAFAEHVGVQVALIRKSSKSRAQRDLF